MKRHAIALCFASLLITACPDEDEPGDPKMDAAGNGDSGGNRDATTNPPDSGVDGGMVDPDSGEVDADSGMDGDLGVNDLGVDGGMIGPLAEEMEAGAYVQVAEG